MRSRRRPGAPLGLLSFTNSNRFAGRRSPWRTRSPRTCKSTSPSRRRRPTANRYPRAP